MSRRAKQPEDPGLAMIAEYERRILAFHDERISFGTATAAERPAVERLAANIGERLRSDYLSRRGAQ